MKMSSIFKKASVFAIAIVMALLMVVSILPAVFATEGETTANFGEKLVASNVSLSGSVKMLYYFTNLDVEGKEFAPNDYIEITISRDGDPNNKNATVITYTKSQLKKDENGRYIVEVPVPYAQQTETITMQWFKDGVGGTIRRKTVKDYATTVLELAKSDAKYAPSVPTVINMLNTGAMTQLHLGYKTDDLANKGLFVSNPVDNMGAEHFFDVGENKDYSEDNEGTGIEFVGAQVFLQSKINLRIYLTCPGDVKEASVSKPGAGEPQRVKIRDDGEGRKYICINNIVSTDFGTRFKIEVANGDKTAIHEYSVLDWALDAVESPFATPAQKDLGKSLYLFYTHTRDYVDNTGYKPGPKDAECLHPRQYSDGASILCSDCGAPIENVDSKIFVSSTIVEPVKVGKPGEIALTFAIAGNLELSVITFTPVFPDGVTATIKETTWHDGFVGDFSLNGVIEDIDAGNNGTFTSGKMVTVVYEISAEEAKAYTVGVEVRGATDAEGNNLESDTLATIVTGTASFQAGVQECAGEHKFEFKNLGATQHARLCTVCNKAEFVDHVYAATTTTVGGKLYRNTAVCECGSIGADNVFNAYALGFELDENDNKTPKAPLFLLSPAEIAAKAKSSSTIGAVETSEDNSYVTIHNKPNTIGMFNLISKNATVTGRYLMIKYRTTCKSNMEFFVGANNGNTGATAGENFYVTTGAIFVKDNEWHTMVLDLATMKPNHVLPNSDGTTYTVDHIRWDIFNDKNSADESIDIAYVAMSDDIMSVASFNGNDYYRVGTGINKESIVKPAYMGSTVTLNPVADAAWIDGSTHTGGQTHVLESDTANGYLEYSHITRKGTSSDNYVYLVSTNAESLAHTTADARYLAVIYRTDNQGTNLQAYIHTSGGLQNFLNEKIFASDSKWRVKVVKIGDSATNYDPSKGLLDLRFDYWNESGGTEGQLIADLAFFGLFNSQDDAYAYCGDYLAPYVNAENGQGCMHDAVTGWQFVSNKGTEYEGTRYAVEAQVCKLCGENAKTRSAVVAVNFDAINVTTKDGTSSVGTWGTKSSDLAGNINKRVFNFYALTSSSEAGNKGTKYPAPSFLRDNRYTKGAGWAGINGLFSETDYYRVLDKDGNVLLDWTSSSSNRNASNAGSAVQTAVNNQISSFGVTSDARRFDTGEIDLSKYASYYQHETSRTENAPITLEYALQAEGAPEGSDLVMVFRATNIYKNCTSHSYHNVTVEENGKIIICSECKNCGYQFSKLTSESGKTPLVVYTAPQMVPAMKATGATQMTWFEGFDLLQDADGTGFVRIVSNGTNGNPYVYVYKPSTVVETGRYLTIRYRIPSTNAGSQSTMALYTSTKNSNMTAGDNGQFPIKKSSNGEWQTIIIDLAEFGSTFKADDNGKYSAKYIRLDLFYGGTKQAGDYVDIQFISISDKLTDYVSASSQNTLLYNKTANTSHSFNQFTGLMSWDGSANLGGKTKITEANGLTYNKCLSNSSSEQNLPIYTSSTALKPVSDYLAIIYRAPKTVMSGGSRINNMVGYPEAFIHSTSTGAVGGSSNKGGQYVVDGTWKVMVISFTNIGATYDPATGMTSLRWDYFNGDTKTLVKNGELHIAGISFVSSAAEGTAWYNEFLNEFYPNGQTEYVTPDVCTTENHYNRDGWVSAGVAEDGTLLEKKTCTCCNATMEQRNVAFRGWLNSINFDGTSVGSDGIRCEHDAQIKNYPFAKSLEGKGAVNVINIKGWFAAEGGVKAYYYRVIDENGIKGAWIKVSETATTNTDTRINKDADSAGLGIDSYNEGAFFGDGTDGLSTGDLAVNYAGQVVAVEYGFCPLNNPGTDAAPNVQAIKQFTNVQVADAPLAAE